MWLRRVNGYFRHHLMPAKTAIIIRHSYADNAHNVADVLRNLSPKGQETAQILLDLLDGKLRPQRLYTSHASRALETAKILNQAWKVPEAQWRVIRTLYIGGEDTYLDAIQHTDPDIDVVCLVGHNPSISYLAGRLCGAFRDGLLPCQALVLTNQDWRANLGTWQLAQNAIPSTIKDA
jgi:phosphohistidine phosphatase